MLTFILESVTHVGQQQCAPLKKNKEHRPQHVLEQHCSTNNTVAAEFSCQAAQNTFTCHIYGASNAYSVI